jgi:DNA-binding GntR family transcriptional regulator
MSATEAAPPVAAGLADEIAYRLQRDILERRIGLGDHLTQDELCARFAVSRTPVREALLKLAGSSLVTLRPNRGAVVRVPGRREVQEIYELRAELEGYAAQRAAGRLDRVRLARLHERQAELAAAVDGGERDDDRSAADPAGFAATIGAANDAVHDLVLQAADQAELAEDVRRLRGRFPKDYVTEAAGSANELRTLNLDDHETILSALAGGDAAGARRAMTDHVARAGLLLTEHLERERFWG